MKKSLKSLLMIGLVTFLCGVVFGAVKELHSEKSEADKEAAAENV